MLVRVAVAAANDLAVVAGVEAAARGGNSVDAAIAAAVTTMVTEPGMVSLSAGGYITLGSRGEEPLTIDGGVEMPGRDRPRAWFGGGVQEIRSGYGGGVNITIGHGSVATPGALAALALLHERSGRAPWPLLIQPALAAVRAGFPLGARPGSTWSTSTRARSAGNRTATPRCMIQPGACSALTISW